MRIAFLAARPMSTTRPIWVKMLFSIPASQIPRIAANKHIGTIRMIENGSDQLSYWAERTRKTKTTARGNASFVRMSFEANICWYVNSVHSYPIVDGNWSLPNESMIAIAWPELTPGAVAPLISADGYRL